MLEIALKKAYRPFWIHAFGEVIELFLCIVICGIVYILIIGIEGVLMMLLIALAVWFLFFLKMFWIPFFSIYEKKKKLFIKIYTQIHHFEEEKMINDYRVKDYRIAKFFSKELEVQRNYIVCFDDSGKRLEFRLIGSSRKMKKIWDHVVNAEEKIYITYGKYTKVILMIEPSEDCANRHNIEYLNRIF